MLIESRGNIPDFGESKKKFLFTEKSVGTNKAKYNDGNLMMEMTKERKNIFAF